MTANTTALTTEFATFRERRDRSVYVARRFSGYLGEAVLDVGCYEAPLRALIGRERYLGVDIAGSPDLVIDLDTPHSLPFGDSTFASVLCIEVLEHLDHLHHVFDELVRVSSRHVIVSLPNCWRDARRPIERGKGAFAHYGLPPERPLDRHKWFFGYAEGRDFLLAAAARQPSPARAPAARPRWRRRAGRRGRRRAATAPRPSGCRRSARDRRCEARPPGVA